ncbi:energy transducer TonB [Mucilaginibacter sp. FT3.2]|uniref:energy transducer TonB n=1 Tax=Mucilaginibacter sp. FT3.2 TaxID=2723090 RepID=UPI0016205E02|nr:energy transducer TonB [Mucilaginibacter sp. FT3.2]MBB6231370.1 protein TonB [Mucilaginibacter sp. FT3.2]
MKLKLVLVLGIFTFCCSEQRAIAQTKKDTDSKVASAHLKEVLPEFPGGQGKLDEFIKSKLHPVKGVSGKKVIVYFVVEKTGKLNHVKVIKGLTAEANKEAVRVIKLSPKWKPGSLNGVARRASYSSPVVFI